MALSYGYHFKNFKIESIISSIVALSGATPELQYFFEISVSVGLDHSTYLVFLLPPPKLLLIFQDMSIEDIFHDHVYACLLCLFYLRAKTAAIPLVIKPRNHQSTQPNAYIFCVKSFLMFLGQVSITSSDSFVPVSGKVFGCLRLG